MPAPSLELDLHIERRPNPRAWLRDKRLSTDFWRFYLAAWLFDFGFGLYFFLFNLFLNALQMDEKSIGWVTGSMTLGGVLATLPVGMLTRKYGLRPLLIFCVVASPLSAALRTVFVGLDAQIALAFVSGAAMCSWPVCFSPAIARLTTEKNRAFAFSLSFATGIGSGALAGLVGGYMPGWMRRAGASVSLASNMRWVLLVACCIVLLATLPMMRVRLEASRQTPVARAPVNLFLLRFLIAIGVWNFALGVFNPFAGIFLVKQLNMPLSRVGITFSASQLLQVLTVLLAPLLYRRVGTVAGIAVAQLATGFALFSLTHAQSTPIAVATYLGVTGFQWMSSPGIYSLLMNETPDAERATASALQNIVSSLSQAAAAAIAGGLLTRFGYFRVLRGNAFLEIGAAVLIFVLLRGLRSQRPTSSAVIAHG